jgi:predicted RNA-binding protein with TRAM domain
MERRFSRNRFGDRGFGDSFEKPVKQDETYDVEIKEVGTRGDGIARVKNFVVFVANGKKGEKAKIKITEVRNRFAIGQKVGEALSPTVKDFNTRPTPIRKTVGTVSSRRMCLDRTQMPTSQ